MQGFTKRIFGLNLILSSYFLFHPCFCVLLNRFSCDLRLSRKRTDSCRQVISQRSWPPPQSKWIFYGHVTLLKWSRSISLVGYSSLKWCLERVKWMPYSDSTSSVQHWNLKIEWMWTFKIYVTITHSKMLIIIFPISLNVYLVYDFTQQNFTLLSLHCTKTK